jgi:ABC-type branched-subunit amino acid transport system ATPase component/ABC-type branched-subunit amino acid transport system permease subunit
VNGYPLFLLLGLASGAAYALLGMGLVLVHRSTGMINFAHGAMAMFCAYVFIGLRRDGVLVLPVVGIRGDLRLAGRGFDLPLAVIITLGYAAVLGTLVYLLIFRPLRDHPTLAKIVASVGLMLILESVAVLRFGDDPRSTPPVLPHAALHVGAVTVPADRILTAAIALVLGGLLAAWYRFSRFGAATEAVAENEKGAVLLGWSAHTVSAVNWAMATVLAAAAGILLVPITALVPGQYTLLIVPALGCALIARLRSFLGVTVVGLVLGMAQSATIKAQTQFAWLPRHGLQEAIPFLLIIVAMTVTGNRMPAPAELARSWTLRARSVRIWPVATLGVAAGCAALPALHAGYRAALIQSMITALVLCSIVVLTGYAGQISLAQLSFAGIGGFTFARITAASAVPLPLSLGVAAVVGAAAGLIVGIPALRVRGVQLAIVTLSAAVVVQELVFNNDAFTGGFTGSLVRPASLLGMNLDIQAADQRDYPRLAFGLFVLALLAVTGIALTMLRAGRLGRAMFAVRGNERAAAAVGVNVTTVKLVAFVIAASIAGVSGAVIGLQRGTLSAQSFDVMGSLTYLAIAVIGGVSRVSGAIIAGLLLAPGGLVATALDRWIGFGKYQLLVAGVLLVVSAIAQPAGIAGQLAGLRGSRGRARPRARRLADATDRPAPPTPGVRIVTERLMPSVPNAGSELAVHGLTVHRGGVRAVADVTLGVRAGEIVGLIGPNGAGKTTFIDAVTGFVPATSGAIRLDAADLTKSPTHRRARAGISRSFQAAELFADLTVADNVRVAAEQSGSGDISDRVVHALALLELDHLGEHLPGELSHGQRKLVGVARALASGPRFVLLDEPAAGLDSVESRDLGERIAGLRDAGIGVLLVDHDMDLVLRVCDRVHVLDFGRLIATGSPAEVSADPAVMAAYFGETVDAPTADERVGELA